MTWEVYVPQNTTVPQNAGFFWLAITSEGKKTWWLFLLIATKKSLNLLNITKQVTKLAVL